MRLPLLHKLYKHIVDIKATIDRHKSTSKIIVKRGEFVLNRLSVYLATYHIGNLQIETHLEQSKIEMR